MSKPPDRTANATTAKKRAQKRGRWAEFRVMLGLLISGHRILAHNYKTKVGEIDVIAQRGSLIRFIEVKARARNQDAAEAVTTRQQSRIARAAEMFLLQNPARQRCDIRFDVCLVNSAFRTCWLVDAWRP